MPTTPKKDNSTFARKVTLRQVLVRQIEKPLRVLETHGGYGKIFSACYSRATRGVVIENDAEKVDHLARQRPNWSVYEGDSEGMIQLGVATRHSPNFIDVDPYGASWPVLMALFAKADDLPDRLAVAVNDGLRQKMQRGSGWQVDYLAAFAREFGASRMFENYHEICRRYFAQISVAAGYDVERWTIYGCGHANVMTHFGAILRRRRGPAGSGTAG